MIDTHTMNPKDPVLEQLPWLRRLAKCLAGDQAEDIVQDTWLAAASAPSLPASRDRLRPWLGQVLRHRWYSLRRSTISRQQREQRWHNSDGSIPDAEAGTRREYNLQLVRDALTRLTREDQELIYERFVLQRTPQDIGATRGMPSATVRTRLHRAIKRLQSVAAQEHQRGRTPWLAALLPPGLRRRVATAGLTGGKGVAAAGVMATALFAFCARHLEHSDTREFADVAGSLAPTAGVAADCALYGREERAVDQAYASSSDVAPAVLTHGRIAAVPAAEWLDNASPAGVEGTIESGHAAQQLRRCALQPLEHDCDFAEPSGDVLDELAACGTFRYDFPEFLASVDRDVAFDNEWRTLVGMEAAEARVVKLAADDFRRAYYAQLRQLAEELGAGPWPADAPLIDIVVGMVVAIGEEREIELSRIIAEERAGYRDEPSMDDGEDADVDIDYRFMRTFADIGDRFEMAMADAVGPRRAHELRIADDGWPGVRSQTGSRCPDL